MDVKESDYTIRDFRFAAGDAMPQLKLHYRTLGAPRIGGDGEVENAVLLLHGTTGGGKQFLKPATADALFAPGKPLDAARYYVILPDAIGHGASAKPSDGMKARFPEYTYGDMVEAQHRLVTEHLGLKTLRLLGGTSMGGMQTWMWAEQYPDAMRALLPVACVPGPVRGRNLLWRRVLIDAIRRDPGYRGGDYEAQPAALGAAWNLFELMAGGAGRFEEDLPDIKAADKHVDEADQTALSEQDANDVVYEFASSKDYDPSGKLDRIKAPLLAVNFADDELNPAQLGVLDEAIRKVPNGRAVLVPSGPKSKGHQSLQVGELWAPYVRVLLDQTER